MKGKILLLISDAGYGHRSAAKAIASVLADHDNCEVAIANPMETKNVLPVIRETEANYDNLVNNLPELYRMAYEASNFPPATSMLESILAVSLYEAIRATIEQHKPDVIISLFPYFQAPLNAYFTLHRTLIPLITVVTDLSTVQRVWFNTASDITVVPTESAKASAVKAGLHNDDVQVLGIPISPKLAEKADKAALRTVLGWQTDPTTILAVGSSRVKNMLAMLHPLNHSGLDLQFVLVAGGDQQLLAEFNQTEWHHPTHIYDFVDNMPDFYKAADCVICKAGGLVVTEALAAGLPMVLINVIEGQETGNANYVVQHEAGIRTKDPLVLLESIYHWIHDDQLATLSRNARAASYPQAAVDVAALAIQILEKPHTRKTRRINLDLQALRTLFKRLNIHFD